MSASNPMSAMILPGERDWIAAVVADLLDEDRRLVYADWLEERGDRRAGFLRAFASALRSMDPTAFPPSTGLPEEWLELIGYRLAGEFADRGFPELKEPAFRLARPALRMGKVGRADAKIAIGGSKVGGAPDLPPDMPWPTGGECKAIYNDDTSGIDRPAGFLAQVNLGEIAHTQAAKDLPGSGLLSFFCFQDIENDNPDVVGVRVLFLPDAAGLVRRKSPRKLSEGNKAMRASGLVLAETLDLPESHKGPWAGELKPDPAKDYDEVLGHFRRLNFENILGYARATSGGDPTPNKQSRHLIVLENSVGCRLHIQLNEKDLAARNFDAVTLAWVDFD